MRTTTLLVFGVCVINYLCWGSPIDNKGAGLIKRVVEIQDDAAETTAAAATDAPTTVTGAPGEEVAADGEAPEADVPTETPAPTEGAPPTEAPAEGGKPEDGGKPEEETPAPPPPPPPVGPSTDKPNSAPPMTQSTAILVLALSTGMFRFC